MHTLLLGTVLVLIGPAHAGPLAREMDRFASEVFPAGGPGATVEVVRDGRVVLRAAYGLADLELDVPMAPEHVLRD